MIDMIRAGNRAQVLSGEILSQILVALAQAAVSSGQPLPRIRTIVFDMHLAVPSVLEIVGPLIEACECPDTQENGTRNEIVDLVRDLIGQAAKVSPAETGEFARQCVAEFGSPETSPARQPYLLFALGVTVLALPDAFTLETKCDIIGAVVNWMSRVEHEYWGLLLVSTLTDDTLIGPFGAAILAILAREARNPVDQQVGEVALVGLMRYLIRLVTQENLGQLEEPLSLVLSRLPLSKGVAGGQVEMGRFLTWISEQMACSHREVLRICIVWFRQGVEPTCLMTIRALLEGLMKTLPDAERLIEDICGDDQLALQNLQDLLAMDE
jgi:hypothetical protein